MEINARPIQKRSQETREKLLRAALSMYTEKGYHSTTVDDIAAAAGASTGIAYRYFRNKKDILLSAISYAAENIESIANISDFFFPEDTSDIRAYFEAVLKAFEDIHVRFRDIHEELEGLQHTDEDVRRLYNSITHEKMEKFTAKLGPLLDSKENIREKAYLAVNIMEQYCHLQMNSELKELDIDVMREKTLDAVLCVLN